ncbi:hypothetical protein NDU88_005337 [Pleurodeles waltl]|uniref:Uncharacterized protein n=1 Tax=Pleurodeles waltl TaxID=8319 RepID=A0AAV7TWU9_PLEWA|nr:hypothetical protein NDU88_005337 [Pleurodeles waltl]
MVNAKNVAKQVTSNISWFHKVTFPESQEGTAEAENTTRDAPTNEREPHEPTQIDPIPQQGIRERRTDGSPDTQEDTNRSHHQSFDLRPNPPPSQRLKDFVCNTMNIYTERM